jgi:di- and tripeptidase
MLRRSNCRTAMVGKALLIRSTPLTRESDEMVNSLRDFVAFRTVPGIPKYAGQCNEAATFLRKLFDLFNAETALLSSTEGLNPILFGRFEASDRSRARKAVLFYGHYDVVDAEYSLDGEEELGADPFQLRPLNGYLYGRGVTDNKGPILAALYAVADLVQNKALNCDVIFLIEGEEEAGSRGFARTVQENRKLIGEIDWILLSNSYWLDDHIPCLTYGMRGVIHASIVVSSSLPDRHSGMDGKSTLHEPLKDLTVLLSGLVGDKGINVQVPGFYKHVALLDKAEKKRYDAITSALMPGHPEIKDAKAFTDSLAQRWREPNLTIHRIEVPESKAAVTISRFAKADLSLRIVPNQDADTIAAALVNFASDLFNSLGSTNKLDIHISSKANAWLGDPNNEIFRILDQAITAVWHPVPSAKSARSTCSPSRTFRRPSTTASKADIATTATISPPTPSTRHRPTTRRASSLASTGTTYTPENMPKRPLYIREGGSIPVISFLEKEFNAPAAMFPCGQASDNAHLDNERMRVQNLYHGREVFRRVFEGLPRD